MYFQFTANRVRLLTNYPGSADVTLQGTPFDFMRVSLGDSSSAAIFASDIVVTGDMEVAERFRYLFAKLNIDWEEQLSKITGDVIAHQVGNFMRALCEWARQSGDNLQQDLTEYVQEEARLLPTHFELEEFLAAVDDMHHDVERLQMRMERLLNTMEQL